MATTIRINRKLQSELSEETKTEIEQARAEIKAGKYHTHSEVRKKLGL